MGFSEMTSDIELLLERHVNYPSLSDSEAARALAEAYQLSYDSVRGRLSRADTVDNRLKVAKSLANSLGDSPSVVRQQEIIKASLKKLATLSPTRIAFVSDVHLPYARWDAIELTAKILEDFDPHETTAQNDFLDNTGYGRWEDDRSIQEKAWSGDLERLRQLEKQVYSMWKGTLIGVMGNHDRWFFTHIRKQSPQSAEKIIADYMEWLYTKCGVLQFSNGLKENHIERGDVVLWHGQFVSKNQLSNARNTIAQFMRNGSAKTVIVGHTHRPIIVDGEAVGYDGVQYVNSPCLCHLDPPYMKRDPKGWGLGIVLIDNGLPHIVQYKEKQGNLVATTLGKEYRVKLWT